MGIDLHKRTHTAVILNCWNEILGTITIDNKPSEFTKLINKVNTIANKQHLQAIYGLENAYGYGRSLAVHLIKKGYIVKDINPALAHSQRMSAVMVQKSDEHDALCVATVLINQLQNLPDAKPEDNYWTMQQLVARREKLVEDGTRLKNSLHEHLVTPYPSYNKFFCQLQSKSAMYFYYNYPSPIHLKNKSKDELFKELKLIASNTQMSKIEFILNTVESDGYTNRDYQEKRDFITRSLVRDLEHQIQELALITKEIEIMLDSFDYKLTTMPYVSTAVASRLIAEIGDISRFSNADKLAKFAGIAPVKFSSAGKGKEQASKQGNRKLNGLFYFLAVAMVCVDAKGTPKNPVFYEYYQRKISDGKTKTQALVCIKRRLVNIIYGMMKNKTEYIPPAIK